MSLPQNTIVASMIVAVATATAGSMWVFDGGSYASIPDPETRFPSSEEIAETTITASGADPVDVADRIVAACADQPCMEKVILDLVDTDGPVESLAALTELVHRDLIKGRGDFHDFVHRVGRRTAKKTGLNPDGFNLCPIDYNYGCQHGFFEQALVEESDAVTASQKVCDPSKMKDKPAKFLFYCYHGVGHGLMMAKAYDLKASLDVCDGFIGDQEKNGCYQGVFMENVVGFRNGTARSAAFSDKDLLAPCNGLDAKYRQQCYLNHGGYLAARAGSGAGAAERASLPCLKAEGNDVHTCLRSVGLNSTNPGWQMSLAPKYTSDVIANAVDICAHFPQGYEQDCIVAGVDNLANFYRSDTTEMTKFCSIVPDQYRAACFMEIGFAVTNEVPAGTPISEICAAIPDEFRPHCLSAFPS